MVPHWLLWYTSTLPSLVRLVLLIRRRFKSDRTSEVNKEKRKKERGREREIRRVRYSGICDKGIKRPPA